MVFAMAQQDEYEGPRFTAHDRQGVDYVLTPVYRRCDDAEGRPLGKGYEDCDIIRIWTTGGETVRHDGVGRYTILSNDPDGEITLTSRDAKAV